MSLDDDCLPPRVLHDRDKDACQPEWQRMALRQREAEVAERKRKADELAAIEQHEVSGGAWLAVFRAQAKDTDSERVHWPHPTNVDKRMFGGDVA